MEHTGPGEGLAIDGLLQLCWDADLSAEESEVLLLTSLQKYGTQEIADHLRLPFGQVRAITQRVTAKVLAYQERLEVRRAARSSANEIRETFYESTRRGRSGSVRVFS